MANRFYLDSSIWSFVLADDVPEFRSATEDFFHHVAIFGWQIYTSEVVFTEVRNAHEPRRGLLLDLIRQFQPIEIPLGEEVLLLSKAYVSSGVLSEGHREDCLHVACATVAGCDYLLSWNFRHLANERRASCFVAVNVLHGYNKPIRICTPLEVYEL